MEQLIKHIRRPGVVFGLVIMALLAIGGYGLYFHRAKPVVETPPPANAEAQVAVSNKPQILRAGVVENAEQLPVNSDYAGRISEIYVKEGQAVKAGQALFVIEPTAAAAAAEPAPKAASPAGDNYEAALKEYTNYQKLYEQGAIPRRMLENAAAKLQAAKDNQGSGQSTAPPILRSPATIAAPVDGLVTGLAASGSAVQPGQQVLALGTGQAMDVVVSLEQNELNVVPLGTDAVIEAAGQTINGRVSSIYPEIQQGKVCFRAHIKPVNPPAGLLTPGLAANVSLMIVN